MFFKFRRTKQPEAGAEAYAFLPSTLNPVYRLTGMGYAVNPPFHAFSEAPFYYPAQLGPVVGIGGLITGGQYFTPLTPTTNNG